MTQSLRKRKTGMILAAAYLVCSLVLGGFSLPFRNTSVLLDTEQHPVYEEISADRILRDFENDTDQAKRRYNGQYLGVTARLISNEKGKWTLGPLKGTAANAISCKAEDNALFDKMTGFSAGGAVQVYGRLTVGLVNGALSIRPDEVYERLAESAEEGVCVTLSGARLSTETAETRKLAGGAVEYRIPAGWKAVEHDLRAEQLGKMEGYQYRLNEAGQKAAYAESFFIGCVSRDELVGINDRDQTRLIEKAVAADILGRDVTGAFPTKSARTYYGASYNYYQKIFQTEGGDRLNTEFIFEEAGEDLIIVCLYVYRDPNHLDEIMTVLRLLKGPAAGSSALPGVR